MASKRAQRRHACGRKIKFPTEEDARERMIRVIRAGKGRGGVMAVYRCRGCGLFHFGHKAREG